MRLNIKMKYSVYNEFKVHILLFIDAEYVFNLAVPMKGPLNCHDINQLC